jgi:hypothetical protein
LSLNSLLYLMVYLACCVVRIAWFYGIRTTLLCMEYCSSNLI